MKHLSTLKSLLLVLFAVLGGVNAWGQELQTLSLSNDQIQNAFVNGKTSSYGNHNISGFTGKYIINKSGTTYFVQLGYNKNTSKSAHNSHLLTPALEGSITSITIKTNNNTTSGRTFYLCNSGEKGCASSGEYGYGTITENNGSVTIDVQDSPNQLYIYPDGTAYIESIEITYSSDAGGDVPTKNSVSFSPSAGEYTTAQKVTLTAGLEESTIYYTTNGEEPTTSSAVYLEPITVTTETTIKTLVVKDGVDDVTGQAVYTIKPAQPVYAIDGKTISSSSVTVKGSASVTISAAGGCSIYYTTDNSNPTTDSTPYTTSINLAESTTLKAIAVDEYGNISSYKVLTVNLVDGVTFDFTSEEQLAQWQISAPSPSEGVNLDDYYTFKKEDISVTLEKGGTTSTRIWNSNGTLDLRLYGSKTAPGHLIVSAPENHVVTNITFEGSAISFSCDGYTKPSWKGVAKTVTFVATLAMKINNITIKTVPVETLLLSATDGTDYYATFSSDKAVEFVDAEVYTVDVTGTKLVLNEVKSKQVPANEGVLIKTASTQALYTYVDAADALENNLLVASSVAMTGDNKYYKLAYGDWTNKTALGFYWGAEDGAAFTPKAGGAYLAVPTGESARVKGFAFGDEETAIKSVEAENASEAIYDLSGRKVSKAVKGLYIINGKKVVK